MDVTMWDWPRRSVPLAYIRVLWRDADRHKLAAQLTAWLGIDGCVDGLVRDVLADVATCA